MTLDTAAFQAKLLTLKAELEALNEASSDARATVELDQTSVGRLSRMDALQGQAMAQETARRRAVAIQRIDAALGRIAKDDFGYCVTCDGEIAFERLQMDPASPTCIACARKQSN